MKEDSCSKTLPEGERSASRRHSGLSALIQAATSQLGDHFHAENDDAGATAAHQDVLFHHARLAESYSCSHAYNTPYNRHQRFPEQLMTLANDPHNEDVITFLPDGKFVAIRANEFAEDLMGQWFAVSTFDEFSELAHDWGYSCLSDRECNIQVLRHPLFIKDNWETCSRIKFGESPTRARLSALPTRIKLDFAIDESFDSLSAGKRRLSPGFLARQDSESSTTSQRLKTKLSGLEVDRVELEIGDIGAGDSGDRKSSVGDTTSYTSTCRHDELRSIALAITTSELRLSSSGSDNFSITSSSSPPQQYRSPLVDRAVESATHTIVTDAIETLLRDKTHTQRTYLKHEEELSRSSLPGVVSLSKQLFSPDAGSTATPDADSSVPEPEPPSENESEQRAGIDAHGTLQA